jgi:2-(1,2-epoxy-1,2-dihydrophenyl)acetyl-CoA isomerase
MAGGDLNDFALRLELSPPARLADFRAMIEHNINPTITLMQSLHQPVIAKVRGACAGFGLSFMLGCDLAVAADDAKFTSAYSAIGLPADGGMSHFLPRMIGRRKAMELLLLAERFDAAEAMRLGLVNRVVAADALDVEVAALARSSGWSTMPSTPRSSRNCRAKPKPLPVVARPPTSWRV